MAASVAFAGEQEIGLTIGALSAPSRSISGTGGGNIDFSTGTAFQADYGLTFLSLPLVDLQAEVHFLASPQQSIDSSNPTVTKDIAVLYLTPGIRLKFLPKGPLSPWASVGGGYSLYEQSTTTVGGATNGAPRHTSHGALQFGGGADIKVLPHIALRGEVRAFYTGSPSFNTVVNGTGQFNVVAGGGVVLRFGK
jgi:opacity protein-like surface antigen